MTTPEPDSARGWMTLVPLVVFSAVAVFLVAGLGGGDPSRVPSPLVGKPAPDFTLPALDGLAGAQGEPVPGFDTADLTAGKVTLVNVWASWCGPCRQEHPLLMELAKDKTIQIAGINYKDNPDNARRFLGSLGQPYGRVGVDRDGRASVQWGVYSVPETFIVDGAGVIRYKWIGPLSANVLMEEILPRIQTAKAK